MPGVVPQLVEQLSCLAALTHRQWQVLEDGEELPWGTATPNAHCLCLPRHFIVSKGLNVPHGAYLGRK